MPALSVCVLTFNSARLLRECLAPLTRVGNELIVVDSGSKDATCDILREFGIVPIHRPYTTHGDQMNFAIAHAANDWVLCIDSDEVLDEETVARIVELKSQTLDPAVAYRITRHWFIMGAPVRAFYPISSPDNPVRLFNRTRSLFNDAPVDDKPSGHARSIVIPGRVRHDTFPTLHEVFEKLNSYTTRLNAYRPAQPSLLRAFLSPPFAFLKWYFVKGSWRDGRVGVVAGVYALLYSFLKYFKSWVADRRAH